jgi:membrane protease YdiL (CAAX protease family)
VNFSLALPEGRLPPPAEEPLRSGVLGSFGFGLPRGTRGFSAWFGISENAWPALIGQTLVFGAIHVQKDVGELVMSVPGGLALGILTYRARSIWPSVVLHQAASAIVLATVSIHN